MRLDRLTIADTTRRDAGAEQTSTAAPRTPSADTPRCSRRLDRADRRPADAPATHARAGARIAVIAAVAAGAARGRLLRARCSRNRPTRASRSARVEWLRDNGARGLVNRVESIYYSLNAPSTGGPALRALPQPGRGGELRPRQRARGSRTRPLDLPAAADPPVIHPGAARRGRLAARRSRAAAATRRCWSPASARTRTTRRWSPASRGSISTRTITWLYPGRSGARRVDAVARARWRSRRSTRGSWWRPSTAPSSSPTPAAAFAIGGHTYAPMKDGHGDDRALPRRPRRRRSPGRAARSPAPNVIYARQNLPLIVDDGRLNPNLSNGPEWGATLGNAIRVWRSAVGIDRTAT